MKRGVFITTGAAALLVMLTAAGRPTLFAQTSAGLLELSSGQGSQRLRRQCVADPAQLAQIEHRGSSCTSVVIRDMPTKAEVHYTCQNGGFGRSEISLITPRSLRLETQGISRGAPYHYLVQARRIGNCPAH